MYFYAVRQTFMTELTRFEQATWSAEDGLARVDLNRNIDALYVEGYLVA